MLGNCKLLAICFRLNLLNNSCWCLIKSSSKMSNGSFVPAFLLGTAPKKSDLIITPSKSSSNVTVQIPNVLEYDEEEECGRVEESKESQEQDQMEEEWFRPEEEMEIQFNWENTAQTEEIIPVNPYENDHTSVLDEPQLLSWTLDTLLKKGNNPEYDIIDRDHEFPEPGIYSTGVLERVDLVKLFGFIRKIDPSTLCYYFKAMIEPPDDEQARKLISPKEYYQLGIHRDYFLNRGLTSSHQIMAELWRLNGTSWMDLKLFFDDTKTPPHFYLDPECALLTDQTKISLKKPSKIHWTSTKQRMQYSGLQHGLPPIHGIDAAQICWVLSNPPGYPCEITKNFNIKPAPWMLNPEIPWQLYSDI